MSIAPTMEVWSQAHAKSDASEHHDAMRMFYAVEANLIQEAEASPANNKIKLITAKLLKQVTAELKAYTELMEGNYYVALGVSSSASSSEVKKAYRKLAMKHHPDKTVAGGCPGADKIFPMIQNAYECLSDQMSRKKYRPEVDLRTCLMKVRAAGKKSSSHASSTNENNSFKSNSASQKSSSNASGGRSSTSHKYPYSRPQKQQSHPYTSSNSGPQYSDNRSYANHKQESNGNDHSETPRTQQKYYSNWKDQWAAEQAAKKKEQDQRRKKNQQTYDDYYYQQQQNWERKKQEEEAEAFKKRMAEIQRKKKEAEERRKRKEAEAKAEAARRKKKRQEREEQFRKQREEEERLSKLKKIVKLPELREMKAKEIKERLKILGHTVTGCIEKEDFVKKYCVVTGQLYKPAVTSSSSGPNDDGSYFVFEEKIRAMSVKELTSFVKSRDGDVTNLLEKSEIVEAALLLYRGVESGGVKKAMGRTQFAFHGYDEKEAEQEEKENQEEARSLGSVPPYSGRKASKPVISTERMRNFENKFRKSKNREESKSDSKDGSEEIDEDGDGVTLEDVVNAYRKRMSRTAFGRAGLNDGESGDEVEKEEDVEEEVGDERKKISSPILDRVSSTSPETLSKDELKKVYEDMYSMDNENDGKEQGEEVKSRNNSPVVSTKWETTSRGKDFLVNGLKWNREEEDALLSSPAPSPSSSSTSSEGVEWEPTSRPLPKHTVNLTPAEAAFIARQQLQREQEDTFGDEGTQGGGAGDYNMDDEAWDRVNQLNATLPNFTIREEVNFWLHGSQDGISEADYLAGESDDEDDEEDDGIDWKVELGEGGGGTGGEDLYDDLSDDDGIEDVTPRVNQFWGQRRK